MAVDTGQGRGVTGRHRLKIVLALCVPCVVLVFAWLARPAAPADPLSGRAMALVYCAYCHIVAPDQAFPPHRTGLAPSFAAIANLPDANAEALRLFLRTTHRTVQNPTNMPDLMLSDPQIANLVAFILTQRVPARPGG